MKWCNIDCKGTAVSDGCILESTEQPVTLKIRSLAKNAVKEIKQNINELINAKESSTRETEKQKS